VALANGTTLGAYEILAQIGAGGMGEVYKASDPRLNRSVAIKVLGPQFSDDPEMKSRFEHEAQMLAGLKHPHICTVFDVGHQAPSTTSTSSGQAGSGQVVDYLVMEYLEGETLADRLKRGALDLDETLKIAIAIADALDKAHRHGVTHRDLKPGNIFLVRSGGSSDPPVPKLLDFGLAKLKQPSSAPATLSALPTVGVDVTTPGTILGTLQYSAPEQLEGKDADARTDIFAFGAVLYEMATGKKAFEGKNQAVLISAIMKGEPRSIAKAQPTLPPALDYVVKRCLAKDPRQRVQTAWDLLGQLQWIAEGGTQIGIPAPVAAERRRRSRLIWTLAAIAGGLAMAMAVPTVLYLRGPAERQEVRFLESGVTLNGSAPFVVSPDGRWIAMTGRDASNPTVALFVRPIGSVTAQRLAGTEGVAISHQFWSADSRSVAFFADGKLKK
jgi:serine/threonine protein kinase